MAAPLRSFAENIEGETISHCGHFLAEEQPMAVAKSITNFRRITLHSVQS